MWRPLCVAGSFAVRFFKCVLCVLRLNPFAYFYGFDNDVDDDTFPHNDSIPLTT